MIIGLGLLTNGLLLLGAWWLAAYGLGLSDRTDRVLATVILSISWCVLGLEGLGTLGLIAIGPLLAWSGLIFAFGLLARWLTPSGSLGLVAMESDTTPWGVMSIVACAFTLWVCVILGMKSLLMAVKVVSDGPIYHLYFAIRWWKASKLFLVASPFGENAATYFPANGDLWFTWLIASWGGDMLAKVGQAPFLAVAAVAAYGIARRLGAGRDSTLIAVCWFITSIPLLIFTFEPNVDTIFVATYLSAVYFMLRQLTGTACRSALPLAGLAAGLALGTKPVGLVFVLPLLCLHLTAVLLTRSLSAALRTSLPLIVGTTLTSGFWFIRNVIVTGNPLYPLQIDVLGRVVFEGCYDRSGMRQSIYYLPISDWRAFADILLSVLDPRLFPFWALAVLGAWSWRSRARTAEDRWVWSMAALALANMALYWLVLPYRTQQRFMLQALGLAATPLARLLDRSRLLRSAAGLLLVAHLATPQAWPIAAREDAIPWDLDSRIPNHIEAPLSLFRLLGGIRAEALSLPAVSSLAVFLGIGACCWLTAWLLSRPRGQRLGPLPRRTGLAIGIVGQLSLATILTGAIGADSRQLFFPPFPDFLAGWLQLDARSGASGVRVAYAGTNIPYYLFCPGLRNEVRYINVDGHREWLLHDYQRAARLRGEPLWPSSRPGWDRAQPDFQAWIGNLRAERISLLVVTVVNPGEGPHNIADADRFPIERQWAESRPDLFEPLYGVAERDRFFRIYRFSHPG